MNAFVLKSKFLRLINQFNIKFVLIYFEIRIRNGDKIRLDRYISETESISRTILNPVPEHLPAPLKEIVWSVNADGVNT